MFKNRWLRKKKKTPELNEELNTNLEDWKITTAEFTSSFDAFLLGRTAVVNQVFLYGRKKEVKRALMPKQST